MNFAEVSARLVVDKKHRAVATERLHSALDSLSRDSIPVFDSEVSFTLVCEVEGEQEVRADIELSKTGK